MGRYDKYEPKGGGFRAPLAADMTAGQVDTILGVGLDAQGRVVIGGGNTGIVGVMCLPRQLNAGDIADVMTDGDIVEAGLNPGTVYYADPADGTLGTTAPAAGANATRVGHTVEGDRLVVRVQEVQGE